MIPESKKLFLAKYGSAKHIDEILGNPSPARTQIQALKHPSISSDSISKALAVGNSCFVREAATRHPKFTKEHAANLINDNDPSVRLAAIHYLKYN